jgi:hypothetical protein
MSFHLANQPMAAACAPQGRTSPADPDMRPEVRQHVSLTAFRTAICALTAAKDAPMDRSRSVMGNERPCRKEYLMRHNGFLFGAVVVAVAAFLLPAAIASAGSPHGERLRHVEEGQGGRHGYGFLPGYEPPEVVEWRNARIRRPAFWYGGPGFYRGRWNGGGFGPCWTPTPIGPHWNCG